MVHGIDGEFAFGGEDALADEFGALLGLRLLAELDAVLFHAEQQGLELGVSAKNGVTKLRKGAGGWFGLHEAARMGESVCGLK